ncbi:hypothetical protein BJX64DRAFT_289004 [Aspergillus heterothallicus]
MAPTKASNKNRRAKKLKTLKRLIEECNINFYPIGEDTPAGLDGEIGVVEEIANASYEQNLGRSSQATIARRNAIWQAVNWCRKNENNEDDWRHEVETKIVNALTENHTCPRCRKRLWRADFEFPIALEHGKRWDDLRRRRRKRKRCVCTGVTENPAYKDRVFKSLRGRAVHYGPELKERVSKGIRPDLVVGLFNAKKWRKVLASTSNAHPGKTVEDVMKCDIFGKDEDDSSDRDSTMIFPFLILEAKRARAPDSLEDIERQMALPAYEMLRTQNRLLENCNVTGINRRLPRVWLVSFKAQTWKLYVATMEPDDDSDGEYVYNMYNVWQGDVSGKRDALKLVLLLDCVFDWALDIYRLDIFEALESSAAPSSIIARAKVAPSVSDLSEDMAKIAISSTFEPHIETLETIEEESTDVIKYKHGWIRDARQVFITAEGVLITATNVADIFDNFEHPDHATRFARLIWELLSVEAWIFPNESILDKIREVWTGERYNRQQVLETPIYVQLEVYTYVDLNWRPMRKLIFVAATKDSIPELFKRTRYAKRQPDEIDKNTQMIDEDDFLAELRDRCIDLSASENLQDAVSRWHCRLTNDSSGPKWVPAYMPSCDKAFQVLFSMYQIGRKEPSENFLKTWHTPGTTKLMEHGNKKDWLVVGETDERDWQHVERRNRAPRLCAFVFRDLDEWSSFQTDQILRYSKKCSWLGYGYTIMRGKYLTGSTHYDDNRPASEYITSSGVTVPKCIRRPMVLMPKFLLNQWIWELDEGETDDSENDDEDYHTDDSDHRGDGSDSESEEESVDEDEYDDESSEPQDTNDSEEDSESDTDDDPSDEDEYDDESSEPQDTNDSEEDSESDTDDDPSDED